MCAPGKVFCLCMYISSRKNLDSGPEKGIGYTGLEINRKGLEVQTFEKPHTLENRGLRNRHLGDESREAEGAAAWE